MKVKYNRISTLKQSGNRFTNDKTKYDLTILERVSGTIPFKERPKVQSQLLPLIKQGKLKELYVEELSRLGRSTSDCISTLEWLEEKQINVVVNNLGLQSRPNNKKSSVWKLISSILSSINELERENIRERTVAGIAAYVANGGVLGRPTGTSESDKKFLNKKSSQIIVKHLKGGLSIRDTAKVSECSTKTVMKTKQLATKYVIL